MVSLSCLTGESVYQCDDYMLLIPHDSHEFNSSDVVLWGRLTLTIIKKQKESQIFLHKIWFFLYKCMQSKWFLTGESCLYSVIHITMWWWFHLAHSRQYWWKIHRLINNKLIYYINLWYYFRLDNATCIDFIRPTRWCDRFKHLFLL